MKNGRYDQDYFRQIYTEYKWAKAAPRFWTKVDKIYNLFYPEALMRAYQ